MIPRRLRLRNFLSYRECDLDLSGLNLAVLSGANGHGKSALLDAMTWALWKRSRGRTDDDVIHLGQHEMAVEFEFDIGDGDHATRYVVNRKRTRGRGAGSLELAVVHEDGSRRSLSGGTITETQQEIIRRVRMDYDTFANSAFVAQGRADEFTRKGPADRKEVFRKILFLERYEQLSVAANDRKKEATIRARDLERNTDAARVELLELPDIEGNIERIESERAVLTPKVEALETAVLDLRQAAMDFTRIRDDAVACAERVGRLAADIGRRKEALEQLRRESERIQVQLAGAVALRERHDALLGLREQDQRLADIQAKAQHLEMLIAQAEAAINQERAVLQQKFEQLARELATAEAAAAGLPALRARQDDLKLEESDVADDERRVEHHRAAESEASKRAAAARAEAAGCKQQNRELKEKLDQLDGVAQCPICRQPLSPDDIEHVRAEYSRLRRDLGARFESANVVADEAEAAAERERAAATTLLADCQLRREQLRTRERELHADIRIAEDAEAAIPAQRSECERVRQVLAGEDFATAIRDRLDDARAAFAGLDYDAEAHARVRRELRDLDGVEDAYRELLVADERGANIERAMADSEAEIAAWDEELVAAESKRGAAEAALEAAQDVSPRLAVAEGELAAARATLEQLARDHGAAGQRRDQLLALRARVEAALDELRAMKEEETVYGDLWKAFGRDGVQAMLIEQALPELELTANEMLDRMTGGRIHVSLMTRRETASAGPKETLDILISDDLGTRDYEMYSGGEAFRVDFALRIALSKLLASQAGAELPTLIIDEGFGTQDREGIDRLVEAINAISRDFRLILVVTHVEELRERFERRIEVVKDPERGSIARII
ncbi:MAG: SMC family ATPase [Chloroflexi bacterium]|nr:SMC family ATPase [Chloroflexota bacterium]